MPGRSSAERLVQPNDATLPRSRHAADHPAISRGVHSRERTGKSRCGVGSGEGAPTLARRADDGDRFRRRAELAHVGKVFSAFMTGNMVFLGLLAAGAQGPDTTHVLVAMG